MYEYRILEQLSVHSFYNYQVSVITLSDKQGNKFKGLTFLPAPDITFNETSAVTGNFDQPLIVDRQQASSLCGFLGEVLEGSLPRKIEVETNGPTLTIHLKKFTNKWYGGGGYKGQVYFKSLFSFLPFISNVTIAKNALTGLRHSLIGLYELQETDNSEMGN